MSDQPPQPQPPQQPPQPGYAPQPPPGGYAYPPQAPSQQAGPAIPPGVSAMLKSKNARNLAAAGLIAAMALALLGSLLTIVAIDSDKYVDLSFMNRLQAAFEWIDIPFVAVLLVALALYHQADDGDDEPDTSALAKQGDAIRNIVPMAAAAVGAAILLFTFLRFIGNLAGDEYGVVAIPKLARFFYDIGVMVAAAVAAFWALAEMQRSGALKKLSQPAAPAQYPPQGYPQQQYPPQQGYQPPVQQPPTSQYPQQPPPSTPPTPPAP